jgi:transcription-repair coupling factor (superfamily II helicase)
MLDRFGEFPQEVTYLFKIAEIKVLAIRAGVELIKQTKDEVTIITSEKTSKEIDGHVLFRSASKFGRMVGLGMEANRLKMVLYVKKVPVQDWLNAAFELVSELERNKKVKEKTE